MPEARVIGEIELERYHVDLATRHVHRERITCSDVEDLLGGIGRGFKCLGHFSVRDAYAPEAPLLLNLGVLSGSSVMTGLRTYLHAYSPLKRSRSGRPSAMWSAGSGKLGTKLRFLGVEELLLTGRAPSPSFLHISAGVEGAQLTLENATALQGLSTHDKIQHLHERYPDAHFAVIGPAGEHYAAVRYAAVALSSENQLKSGDAKARYCGRGGMGGVMGSKNLLAIVADAPDRKLQPPAASVKEINRAVGQGEGSRRFREPKTGGLGGTWANAQALGPSRALPEYNFMPTGDDVSEPLFRPNVEADGRYEVKDEACYRCGIRCHKNVYIRQDDGRTRFLAKFDYEPLNLLSSNLGIFEVEQVGALIELADLMGLDAISCGVTLSYAMEYNRRHPADPIADGLAYGDFEGARRAVLAIGRGELPLLGQGVLRLSEARGEGAYAMQCKGMEFPAYLPQTNPGYPWALAGGHMSMRTYLLLLNERETSLDYWVDAITSPSRGLSILRDDLVGICKFSGLSDTLVAEAVEQATGVAVDAAALQAAVLRTHLRGYRLEKQQGFGPDDYEMPADALREHPAIDLPYFVTPEFEAALRDRVLARFDALLEREGL